MPIKNNQVSITCKKYVALFSVFLLLSSVYLRVKAEETSEFNQIGNTKKEEIIFLVDCSESMKEFGDKSLIVDFIEEAAASVPSFSEIGVVAYGNEVQFCLEPGSTVKEIKAAFTGVNDRGYGDAGAGLKEAVALFKRDENSDKKIVFISDGEILMKNKEQTENSVKMFREALITAEKKNIKIDIITFGSKIDQENIYSAAEGSGGAIYEFQTVQELSAFAASYLFDDWGIKCRSAGQLNGLEGEINLVLPDTLMKKAKIILSGAQDSENTIITCEAEKMSVDKGIHYTAIELINPRSENVKIKMNSKDGMNVSVFITAEYDVIAQMSQSYNVESGMAVVAMDLLNKEGKSLLKGHLGNEKLPLLVNGKAEEYNIEKSGITVKHMMQESGEINISADLNNAYGNYYGTAMGSVLIEVPIIEEEPKTDWFLYSVIAVFVIGIVLLFYLYGRKRKYGKSHMKAIDRNIEFQEEKRFLKKEFNGKLLLYVIRNREGIEYPPESINLFARCKKEVITLQWLLDICGIPLEPEGADRIIFKPGEDRQLMVKNSSRATALKGREVLLKSHQYPLYYHEKITFIFEGEDIELEIHYKDIK